MYMNVLQHTRNKRNPCLKQNRPDRSYRDTLLNLNKILCQFGQILVWLSKCWNKLGTKAPAQLNQDEIFQISVVRVARESFS